MAKQNSSVIHRFFDSMHPMADAYNGAPELVCDWQYIWAAVIMQAFSDIKSTYKSLPNVKYRQEAIEWLNTPDFETVCDFANANPVVIKKYALELANYSKNGIRLPNLDRKSKVKAQTGVKLRIHTS